MKEIGDLISRESAKGLGFGDSVLILGSEPAVRAGAEASNSHVIGGEQPSHPATSTNNAASSAEGFFLSDRQASMGSETLWHTLRLVHREQN